MSLAKTMIIHGPGSPRYREEVVYSAGEQIALSVWQAEPPTAASPVLVFVPGTMTHPLAYAAALDGLAARGITVVGVHPTGHGNSPRDGRPIRLARIITNVRDAVEWAAAQWDGPIVLNGSSQGGVVALLAAVDAHPRVRLVVPHNALLPELPDTLSVTRIPRSLTGHYDWLRAGLRVVPRLLPRLAVPFGLYLDPRRVFSNRSEKHDFMSDPRNLQSYPLAMLSDLLSFDSAPITEGSIEIPVVVLASTGDPLFSLDYVSQVVEQIKAPSVELVTLELPMHLIYVGEPDVTADALAEIITTKLG